MKKLVSLISAFAMCTVMTLPVFSVAEEESKDNKQESQVFQHSKMISEVELIDTFKCSYTVTIPDGEADLSKPVDFKISASNVIIGLNQTLDVSVKSKNEWRLLNVDTENEPDDKKEYVSYELVPISLTYSESNLASEENISEHEDLTETDSEIKTELYDIPLSDSEKQPLNNENNIILSVKPKECEDKIITKILTATVTEDAKVAGMYTDTLTFMVEINGNFATTPETESLSDNPETEHSPEQSDSEPEET